VLTKDGPLRIEVPRDRDGTFERLLIAKHERRFTGFDDKIVAMYARGKTVREIQGLLAEQHATEVSPEFISSVTDAVMAEVTAWQSRPLGRIHPVIFFDALRVKSREDAVVRNKATQTPIYQTPHLALTMVNVKAVRLKVRAVACLTRANIKTYRKLLRRFWWAPLVERLEP